MNNFQYSAIDIANWFLSSIDREAGDSITHLKLQKLVYYAQAWSLVLNNRELFEEDFQAWTHGPVARSIWETFKGSGVDMIPLPTATLPEFDEESDSVLRQVFRIYGELSARRLEDLTHREDPWRMARNGLPDEAKCETVITKESMQDYYSALLARMNE